MTSLPMSRSATRFEAKRVRVCRHCGGSELIATMCEPLRCIHDAKGCDGVVPARLRTSALGRIGHQLTSARGQELTQFDCDRAIRGGILLVVGECSDFELHRVIGGATDYANVEIRYFPSR
jgi:hypothetical protein